MSKRTTEAQNGPAPGAGQEGHDAYEGASARAAKAEAERDQALQDAEDLRAVQWGLNEDINKLMAQLAEGVAQAAERTAQQLQALSVREEELAAALGLPQRRSWPDLLAAARRLQKAEENAAAAEQRAHELANRAQALSLRLERRERLAAAGFSPLVRDPDPRSAGPGGEDLPDDSDCTSCMEAAAGGAEDCPRGECPKSKRSCGHHCNCSWTQDRCCWCGAEIGEDNSVPPPPPAAPPPVSLRQTACDRCTQGVMDYGNDHLHGRCRCSCHAIGGQADG